MDNYKNFAWPVTDTYSDNVIALKRCLEQYGSLFHEQGIVLFGAGIRGNEFLKLLERDGYSIIAFIDNNKDKQGGYINSYPIVSLDDIVAQKSRIPIIITPENSNSIRSQLISHGMQEDIDFFRIETDAYSKFIEEFRRSYSCNILSFGDCCFTAVSLMDTNWDSLSYMLQQQLGKDEIKILAMHGMGMGGYYHILRMQIANGFHPKRLLLEINSETFMPRHHLLPRSQHIELMEMIYALPGCQDKDFRDYVDLSTKRFNTLQTDFFSTGLKNNSPSQDAARLFFKIHYMYSLDCETEGFTYYIKILSLLKTEGIAATLFVPPVNYQYAEELFGEEFRMIYENNLKKLRNKTEEAGFSLLELSYLLTPEEFCSVDTPTETCNYSGRSKICSALTESILTSY